MRGTVLLACCCVATTGYAPAKKREFKPLKRSYEVELPTTSSSSSSSLARSRYAPLSSSQEVVMSPSRKAASAPPESAAERARRRGRGVEATQQRARAVRRLRSPPIWKRAKLGSGGRAGAALIATSATARTPSPRQPPARGAGRQKELLAAGRVPRRRSGRSTGTRWCSWGAVDGTSFLRQLWWATGTSPRAGRVPSHDALRDVQHRGALRRRARGGEQGACARRSGTS